MSTSDSSKIEAPTAPRQPPRKLHNLAYGLERLGLIPLRAPVVSAIILAVLCVIAAFGVERIKVDDSLSQLFRSDTTEFQQYEEVTKRFPSSEFDVLVVVEGKNLMARESIEKLRDLVTDLQLIDSVRGLISLFSARQPPEAGKHAARRCSRRSCRPGADYDALVKRVLTNEIIRGKLLSEDGTLALVVLSLDPKIVGGKGLNTTVGEIRKIMQDDLGGTGLTVQLLRRADHAARDPQRRRARHAALQHHRLRRRLPDRDPVLPPRLVHDHRGRAAADRDPAVARRARLAQFQPQHVPQRDDAAHHGDQLLRQHAAHLRGARPADRRGRTNTRRSARPCWWSARPAC